MKRIIALTMAVLMIAALLVACGGPEGKYQVKTMNGKDLKTYFEEIIQQTGENVTLDEYLEKSGIGKIEDLIVFELTSDGKTKFTINSPNGSYSKEGTWEKNGDTIKMTVDGDSQEFTMKGNELSANLDGTEYVFVKK